MRLPKSEILKHNGFIIVSDAILPGGFKQRYIGALIKAYPKVEKWVYASPTYGYAQIALACACEDAGKKAVIFVPERKKLYEYTSIAKKRGALIKKVPMGFLSNCQSKANKYVEKNKNTSLIPFGCDHEIILQAIEDYARSLKMRPKEVWTSISSGTLSRGLQRAWPRAKFYGVQVGHKVSEYERGHAEIFIAPEKYEKPAKNPPPFPSCANYDAKVWGFMLKHASPGALFWNVAG